MKRKKVQAFKYLTREGKTTKKLSNAISQNIQDINQKTENRN